MEDVTLAGVAVAALAAGGAWLKNHEQRIATAEAVIKKLDQFMDLMIEDKLQQKAPRGKS